jgi:hypothetical protein
MRQKATINDILRTNIDFLEQTMIQSKEMRGRGVDDQSKFTADDFRKLILTLWI